jgi:hypothetical protein
MIGKHSSTALHTLLTDHEKVQSIEEIGFVVVFAFGSETKIKVEPGSHRRPKIRVPLKARPKPTIELDPVCVKDRIEAITLNDGGRLIIDPRLNFCILEGDGMMFTYWENTTDRPPMRFLPELEDLIRGLETDKFKIHAQFGKRVEPAAPETGRHPE